MISAIEVLLFAMVGGILWLLWFCVMELIHGTRHKKALILQCLKQHPEGLRAYAMYERLRPHVGPWEIYGLCRSLERSGDLVSSEVVTAAITVRGDRPVVVYRLSEKHR